MLQSEKTRTTAKRSSRVQKRRKPSFLQTLNLELAKSTNKDKDFGFIKQYGGNMYCKLIAGGIYQIRWRDDNGRSALAFGSSFIGAYLNLEKKFNQKYLA